ncbi:MAG: NUDIX domain-containing protein [Planctomycetota bacterium]
MSRRFSPAQFGDLGQRHEVHVFLYRYCGGEPEYLLLQATPTQERVWRPVVGPVDWDEDLRHAAIRQVQAETGLTHAFDLVSPAAGLVQELGDLQMVLWPVGYQVANPSVEPRLTERLAAWDWCPFEQALHILDASLHRQNLLQLHLQLAA